MQHVLIFDPNESYRKRLGGLLSDLTYVHEAEDLAKALTVYNELTHSLALILIGLDQAPEDGFRFLHSTMPESVDRSIPVLVVSESPNNEFLDSVFDSGVTDYLSMGMPDTAIRNRLMHMLSLDPNKLITMNYFSPLARKSEHFFFNNCIGPAVVCLYDGQHMQGLMINDAFYDFIGKARDEIDPYKGNFFDNILPQDTPGYMEALKEAQRSGKSSCIMHQEVTGQSIQVVFNVIERTENGIMLLFTCHDITKYELSYKRFQTISELPGTIMFEYEPSSDLLVITACLEHGTEIIRNENFLREPKDVKWLSPETGIHFRDALEDMLMHPGNRTVTFKARFDRKHFTWQKVRFRSISDGQGNVFRIVGRFDDIEKNEWDGVSNETDALVDPTTELLTFNALREYIQAKLGNSRSGALMLFNIEGISHLTEGLGLFRKHELLVEISSTICLLCRNGDIFGRFGRDGFLLFLPEAYNEYMIRSHASHLLNKIKKVLDSFDDDELHCCLGIAIADSKKADLSDLLGQASEALRKAQKGNRYDFNVYSNNRMTTYAMPEWV